MHKWVCESKNMDERTIKRTYIKGHHELSDGFQTIEDEGDAVIRTSHDDAFAFGNRVNII